jgi:hypothetical protein
LRTSRSRETSSAPSRVRSGRASERVRSGTPNSFASATVRSEVGIPRTPRSSPAASNSPILLTTQYAVDPVPRPRTMQSST